MLKPDTPVSFTGEVFEYGNKVFNELNRNDIRVEIDTRSESIGKKIREAEMQKIPYMIIIGDKEAEQGNISIRKYKEGDKGQISILELIDTIKTSKK